MKFSTCTLLGSALTWWNSHVRTVGHDVAYAMTWTDLKKKMTDKYCPRSEIKKLEVEIMFPEESNKVEKYVGGLPDMLHGSVVAFKPKTMQDAIEIATELMDKKIPQAYAAGTGERKEYAGTLLLCNKCKFHHNGQCTIKCANSKKVSHLTQDCRSPAATNNQRNITCYECGNLRHYRSDCPELKNQNHGNHVEGEVHFGKRGKLNPRYVGPSKFMEKVGYVAYKLEFPQELSKVRWNSKRGPEFTWEREDQFRKKYPHLFTKTAPSQESVVPQTRSPTQTHVADEAASTGVDVRYGGAATTVTGLEVGHGSGNIDKTPTMSQDSPLLRVNTLGSDEDSLTL
ncbi:reverse transcriptase domain-containing protein [Tanacetum coccineum]